MLDLDLPQSRSDDPAGASVSLLQRGMTRTAISLGISWDSRVEGLRMRIWGSVKK